MKLCTFPGCDREHEAKGLCRPHYAQQRAGYALGPIGKGGRRPGSYTGTKSWAERQATVELSADSKPVTDELLAKIEAEVASGVRCACWLLMPCHNCTAKRRAA